MKGLEDGNLVAKLCQITCTGQTCRTGTDDGNLLAIGGLWLLRNITMLSGIVGNETLQLSDGNRIALDATDTLALALCLLRTYTTANSRKCGGLCDDISSLCDLAFLYRMYKCRNINGYWTSLNTLCILTVDTAGCLLHSLFHVISKTDFIKIGCTNLRILFSDWDSI